MEYSQRLIQRVLDTQEYYRNVIKDMTSYLSDVEDALRAFHGMEFNQTNAEAIAAVLSQGYLKADVNILKDKMFGPWSVYGVYTAPGELPFDTRCIDMYLGALKPEINAAGSLYHLSINAHDLIDSINGMLNYNIKRWHRIVDFDVHTWTTNREIVEIHLENLKSDLPPEFNHLNYMTDLKEEWLEEQDEEDTNGTC
jgi:hypothetical protein